MGAESLLPTYLHSPHIRIADPVSLRRKLDAIASQGVGKLQVITDFDYTLSRYRDDDGKKCWTTHAVFDHEVGLIDPKLSDEMNALREKYMKIEFDHSMSVAEKIPHMITWWSTAHDRIAKYGFTKEILRRFVVDANVLLRTGVDKLISQLAKSDTPLVVFSAGLGDIIKLILEHRFNEVPSNLHLISNMMIYDDKDTVIDFALPLIHTFNKNGSVIDNEHEFFERLAGRPNVILMGDSLGDLHMDTGVVNEGEVLKIGFLNFDVERLLPDYLAGYDIVLVEDQSMDIPLHIIESTTAKPQST